MLTIKEIRDKDSWENFLTKLEIEDYPFFQAWNFGEVQKKLGFEISRLGLYDKKKLIGICQIIDVKAKRGHYLHLRHGPVLIDFNKYIQDFLSYIKAFAQNKNIDFIRMSPLIKKEDILFSDLRKMGFRDAPIHNQDAEICWVLDIEKSKEELLKDMRKSHRYLIKKSLNMDIKIIRTKKVSDIDNFLPLYNDLSLRKHFVPHKGLAEEFGTFAKEDQEVLFLAKYKNKIIAGSMIAYVDNTAIYRHSASNDEFRDIPAMYLILWEAILEAKERHKKTFNFWGIAPSISKNHPWFGLTLFKTGFGGERREFIHAQDLPLSPKYWKTYLIESVSKRLKGY